MDENLDDVPQRTFRDRLLRRKAKSIPKPKQKLIKLSLEPLETHEQAFISDEMQPWNKKKNTRIHVQRT